LEDPNFTAAWRDSLIVNAQPQGSSAEELIKLSLKMQPILWRIAGQWVKRRELIEEVLQDVRVSILTSHSANVIIFPKAWLVKLTRNRAIDLARHIHTVHEELVAIFEGDEEFCASTIDPARLVEADDELHVMIQAMHSLPTQQRQVITLKKIYGYSQKEIAQRLKIAEHTVEHHMVRALRNLALIIGQHLGYAAQVTHE